MADFFIGILIGYSNRLGKVFRQQSPAPCSHAPAPDRLPVSDPYVYIPRPRQRFAPEIDRSIRIHD
jgi:hypothetical protein